MVNFLFPHIHKELVLLLMPEYLLLEESFCSTFSRPPTLYWFFFLKKFYINNNYIEKIEFVYTGALHKHWSFPVDVFKYTVALCRVSQVAFMVRRAMYSSKFRILVSSLFAEFKWRVKSLVAQLELPGVSSKDVKGSNPLSHGFFLLQRVKYLHQPLGCGQILVALFRMCLLKYPNIFQNFKITLRLSFLSFSSFYPMSHFAQPLPSPFSLCPPLSQSQSQREHPTS